MLSRSDKYITKSRAAMLTDPKCLSDVIKSKGALTKYQLRVCKQVHLSTLFFSKRFLTVVYFVYILCNFTLNVEKDSM